ncbi:ubiquitin-associated domain-containing protein 2 [Limosa lapponica baueri]|uniref:Ubiquitin-associated domain-containing protein 2 n=1 Tax=Limosa lapponica baueri TaxID=1758121 RepID=A0A2I0TSQ0_LIMLA|nr:ubiquitin-associated domain-containing protein 2 [Limosa lapponica baueri]
MSCVGIRKVIKCNGGFWSGNYLSSCAINLPLCLRHISSLTLYFERGIGNHKSDKAPLSKSLLLVPSAISILLTLLFQHYQKFFAYNLQAIKEDFQSFLLGAWMLSALFDLLLVEIAQYVFGITINSLPSGL